VLSIIPTPATASPFPATAGIVFFAFALARLQRSRVAAWFSTKGNYRGSTFERKRVELFAASFVSMERRLVQLIN